MTGINDPSTPEAARRHGRVAATKSQQSHAIAASFLGWTLDAFDFFVVVFLFDTLSNHFHVSKEAISKLFSRRSSCVPLAH